jgi:hypothetical protein
MAAETSYMRDVLEPQNLYVADSKIPWKKE